MTQVDAWLGTLAGYVIAYRRTVNGPALAQHLRTLIEIAKPVFRELGGTRSPQEAAIALIGHNRANRNGMPTRDYAVALAAVRGQMVRDRKKLSRYLTSASLHANQREMATLLLQMMNPDPTKVERQDAKLDRMMAIVPDQTLKLMMTPQSVERQDAHVSELKHIVRQSAKRDDTVLTADEKKALAARNPNRAKRYNELKKKIKQSWEQFVRGMVRENHGRAVKVLDARKALDAAGIRHHPELDSPGMDRLRIGESTNVTTGAAGSLSFFTMDGTELLFKPAPDLTIVPNPKWDPRTDDTFVLKIRSPHHGQVNGRDSYTAVRSIKFAGGNKDKGYDAILEAIPHIPRARAVWLRDLHGSDRTRRVMGAMAEVAWHFATRTGTVGRQTRGLATLRVSNVSPNVKSGGVILNYVGKDSQSQRHVLAPKDPYVDSPHGTPIPNPNNRELVLCVNIIKQLMRGKGRNDYLWTDATGQRIGPGRINEYVRKRCGFPLTPEKFRNIRGTMMMRQMLPNARLAKDAPIGKVSETVKKLALHVGELLGHVRTNKEGEKVLTATTAIKNYIVPSIIHDFFAARGYQTPKWVPKKESSGRSDE